MNRSPLTRPNCTPAKPASVRFRSGPAERATGFVLWEMMLALMIFCVVAVSLTTALRQAIDTVVMLRDDAQTRHEFENLLAESAVIKLQPGRTDVPIGDGRIRYEREVVRLESKTLRNERVSNLYQVTVRAYWQAGGQARTSQAASVFYQPPS